MTLSRRQFGTAAAGAAFAMAYGKPGWAQAPLVIKYSHVVANDTPKGKGCLLYTSPSPRDRTRSRMPSSA